MSSLYSHLFVDDNTHAHHNFSVAPQPQSHHSTPPSSDPKKRHSCPTCARAFTTSGHLARHIRVHTGERNHKCPFPGCETRCSRQDNLQQHYRIHLSPGSRRASSSRRPAKKSSLSSSASSTPSPSSPPAASTPPDAPPPLARAVIGSESAGSSPRTSASGSTGGSPFMNVLGLSHAPSPPQSHERGFYEEYTPNTTPGPSTQGEGHPYPTLPPIHAFHTHHSSTALHPSTLHAHASLSQSPHMSHGSPGLGLARVPSHSQHAHTHTHPGPYPSFDTPPSTSSSWDHPAYSTRDHSAYTAAAAASGGLGANWWSTNLGMGVGVQQQPQSVRGYGFAS